MRISYLVAGVLAAGVASPAVAQSSTSVGPFLAYTAGHHLAQPAAAGAQLVYFAGPLGVRGGAAILTDANSRLDASAPDGWDVDGDLLLRLGRAGGATFSLVPYAFTGVGGRSRPDVLTGARDFFQTWSYGAGLSLGVSHALEITGEARQRAMRAVGATQWRSTGGAEMRLGLMFRM